LLIIRSSCLCRFKIENIRYLCSLGSSRRSIIRSTISIVMYKSRVIISRIVRKSIKEIIVIVVTAARIRDIIITTATEKLRVAAAVLVEIILLVI